MKNDLQILKQELIERWINAFDEFDHFKTYEKEVVSVTYADDIDAYNIGDYSSGRIESTRKFFDQPTGDSYCEYGLNEKEQPVVAILFNSNIVSWIGFYKWNKDLVEYVEFCYSNHVPSALHRLVLKEDKKQIFQSLNLNGRGSYPIFSSMSKEEIIKHTLNDDHTLIFDIKEFKYSDDKIMKADGFASAPGIGEYYYEDVYSYDKKSSLDKIERFSQKWPSQLMYIKPSGKSIEKLIDDLSGLFAAAIAEAFGDEKIVEPIFNVQLNFHAADNYWPYITMITDKEKEAALINKTDALFIGGNPVANEILQDNITDEIDEMFAEFDQYVQHNEAWDIGSELLTRTSMLLTKNKLMGKTPVSNDFIVFAIDWSMVADPDETEDVLLRCGADSNNVKNWRNLNWF